MSNEATSNIYRHRWPPRGLAIAGYAPETLAQTIARLTRASKSKRWPGIAAAAAEELARVSKNTRPRKSPPPKAVRRARVGGKVSKPRRGK